MRTICSVLTILVLSGAVQAQCGVRPSVSPSYVSTPSYTPSYAPTYYNPVYAAVFLPVTVAVPSFGVGYTAPLAASTYAVPGSSVPTVAASTPTSGPLPSTVSPSAAPAPATTTAASPCMEKLAKLEAELVEMKTLIKGMGGSVPLPAAGGGPAKADAPPTPMASSTLTYQTVLKNKCLACHGVTADKDGGKFVMFELDGSLTKLTDRQINKIVGRTYNGSMPPKGNSKGIAPLTDEEFATIVTISEGK